MDTNYTEKIKNIYKEAKLKRSRTVFVNEIVQTAEILDDILKNKKWKTLTKEEKLSKINDFLDVNSMKIYLNKNNLKLYCIKNIVFDSNIQEIKSLEITKK
jgi:hypothetical protein